MCKIFWGAALYKISYHFGRKGKSEDREPAFDTVDFHRPLKLHKLKDLPLIKETGKMPLEIFFLGKFTFKYREKLKSRTKGAKYQRSVSSQRYTPFFCRFFKNFHSLI